MLGPLAALLLVALLASSWSAPDRTRPASLEQTADDQAAPQQSAEAPRLLSETGLYSAGAPGQVAPDKLFYVPQYPLWSDGATKRRWISLPAGRRIDATRPDAWQFPVGTRFWKELSFGERTETRTMERLADGSWRYASYVWDAALGDAVLAPEQGITALTTRSGVQHAIPSQEDCRSCHEGRSTAVLGFGALQLSAERDPLAAHREPVPHEALDLPALVARDLLSPVAGLNLAPRITAPSARSRAALGYLFGNCAGCHNGEGPLSLVGLDLDQPQLGAGGFERVLQSTLDRPSRFLVPGQRDSHRIVAGQPAASALWVRMHARDAASQMPPLATRLVDEEGSRLVAFFIQELANHPSQKETSP